MRVVVAHSSLRHERLQRRKLFCSLLNVKSLLFRQSSEKSCYVTRYQMQLLYIFTMHVWCRSFVHRLPIRSPLASSWVVTSASSSRFSTGPFRCREGEWTRSAWSAAPQPGRRRYCSQQIKRDQAPKTLPKRQKELICSITYPETKQPNQSNNPGDPNTSSCSDELLSSYEGKKCPVVVLLGWTDCRDKELAKFSAIFENKCITLRCTFPGEYLAHGGKSLFDATRRTLEMIMEKGFNEHPIFFVVFSNGGAIFYQQISVAMQKAGSPLKVKGVIFDSGPGVTRLLNSYKAARLILSGHPLSIPLAFMYSLLFSFTRLLEDVYALIGKSNAVSTDAMRLIDEPYTWPQLFLYSNSDVLIWSSDVEKFASQRAKRGVRTQLVLFTDSGHVKHMSIYRDIYVSTVYRFVNECLVEKNEENADEVREEDALPCLTKRIILPQDVSHQAH